MSYHKILVQPAKTARGRCKKCKKIIDQDTLKIQVVDDRKFNDYIKRNGGRSVFHGQGMSRGGYIEAPEGVISIERFFVHLHCYTPIHPHPWSKDQFKMERFGSRHKAVFQHWLQQKSLGRAVSPPPLAPVSTKEKRTKNKPIKKTKKRVRRVV